PIERGLEQAVAFVASCLDLRTNPGRVRASWEARSSP
ncbi:MAG: hypothetical protein ACI9F9_000549, partial [Candidatus Paceibacteria bacterium]